MTFLKSYKIPLIITLILCAFHFASKDFNNPYQRPIAGDAQAYYAYLPATFIYQDFSYGFIPEVNEKYYPKGYEKSFLKPAGEGKVNKTFPGIALLYLPFFLIAHALALMFGLEADGYSTIYQVCFDVGYWFYLLAGLIAFQRVLRQFNFTDRTVNLTTFFTVMGTNMVFYSVYDQSVTHIYNFFMINALLLCLLSLKTKLRSGPLVLAFFLLALIGITRPTNVLVLGLILFFIPEISFYKNLFLFAIRPKNSLYILLVTLPVLMLPFSLWKIQTGLWVVYSYGQEGFNFADPYFGSFLFSYLKGWFTYTPLALVVLIFGLVILFKTDRKRFTIALLFYLLAVYVFSSWWCWYYGAGMGQRVMIDHYVLLGFLMATIIRSIARSSFKKIALAGLGIACIGLNWAQAYQIRYGILSGGSATQEQYWDNFLVMEKRARIYPHDHWEMEMEADYSFAPNDTSLIKGMAYPVEGDWTIQVSEYTPFSAIIALNLGELRSGSKLLVRFEARARHLIEETRLVLDMDGKTRVFFLKDYLKKDQWVTVEFMVEPEQLLENPVLLYFWNASTQEKVEIRALYAAHYFSENYL